MNSSSKIHYKGWEIVPLAVPTTDGKWSASCDIERATAEGLEVFEGSTMQFVRDDEEGAIAAACDSPRRAFGAFAIDRHFARHGDAIGKTHTEAAAELALATGVLPKRVLLDENGVADLLQLDG